MTDSDIGRSRDDAPTPTATAQPEPVDEPEPRSRPSVELDIATEAGDWSSFPDAEQLVSAAAAALVQQPQAAALAGGQASIVLADDAMVQGLNASYRGKDQPTNVLSFPFEPPPGVVPPEAARYLGDIILASETLLREAADLGIPPAHHLQHLVVHGLLHLVGFDHIEAAQAEAMEALETRVLAGLGIADPYAD